MYYGRVSKTVKYLISKLIKRIIGIFKIDTNLDNLYSRNKLKRTPSTAPDNLWNVQRKVKTIG